MISRHGGGLVQRKRCRLQIEVEKPKETPAQAKRRIKLAEARAAAKEYKARQRMLGNIQFIGQLYNKKMLTDRIMHECIVKLLGEVGLLPRHIPRRLPWGCTFYIARHCPSPRPV